MNKLKGTISSIQNESALGLVHVRSHGVAFEVVLIEGGETYTKGQEIELLFKETEIIICTQSVEGIGIRNKIPATVVAIEKGQLMSLVQLQVKDAELVAVVTNSVLEDLGIEPDQQIHALIKSNEIMIGS